jgi:hypothetical protein
VDFVVVGFGLGGLAIVLGLMLGWAAASRDRAALRAPFPEVATRDRAIARDRRGAGQALLSAGGAVLVATIGALVGGLDDQTGAFFVTTTATVSALGVLVWAYLHRSRHPRPPRARRQLPSAPAAEIVPTAAASLLVASANEPLGDAESPRVWDFLAERGSPEEASREGDLELEPGHADELPLGDDLDVDLGQPPQSLIGESNNSLNGRAEAPDDAIDHPGTDEHLAPVARGTAHPPATPDED